MTDRTDEPGGSGAGSTVVETFYFNATNRLAGENAQLRAVLEAAQGERDEALEGERWAEEAADRFEADLAQSRAAEAELRARFQKVRNLAYEHADCWNGGNCSLPHELLQLIGALDAAEQPARAEEG